MRCIGEFMTKFILNRYIYPKRVAGRNSHFKKKNVLWFQWQYVPICLNFNKFTYQKLFVVAQELYIIFISSSFIYIRSVVWTGQDVLELENLLNLQFGLHLQDGVNKSLINWMIKCNQDVHACMGIAGHVVSICCSLILSQISSVHYELVPGWLLAWSAFWICNFWVFWLVHQVNCPIFFPVPTFHTQFII